jgi:DNA (cytosine-5)-methyltransferase 1
MVHSETWGKFAPAIHQWETITNNPAPLPTIPDGRDGQSRLNPQFAEWMMGLPKGWITDCDITRNEQLKACGNGVVPQQATLAITQLLQGLEI